MLIPHFSSINYILVHALRDRGTKRRASSLESWFENVAKKASKSYQARVHRLRMSDMMERSKSAVQDALASFQKKVLRIYSESVDASQMSGSQEDQSRAATHEEPLFIFVAHGIGAWFVKHALAHDANEQIAMNTLGLLFLDLPTNIPTGSTLDDYDNAITCIRRTFSDRMVAEGTKATNSKPALVAEFRSIDFRFADRSEYFARKSHGNFLKPLPVMVWMPSESEQRSGRADPPTNRNPLQGRLLVIQNFIARRRQSIPLETIDDEFRKKMYEIIGRSEELRETGRHNHTAESKMPSAATSGEHGGNLAMESTAGPSSPAPTSQVKQSGSWKSSARHGRSCLARGNLKHAQASYEEAMRSLTEIARLGEGDPRGMTDVQIGEAVTMLLQGHFQLAEQKLRELSTRFQGDRGSIPIQLIKEVKRWHAVSLMNIGDYERAADLLEQLVASGQGGATEDKFNFRVKRDLAVAYGLQGTLDKAVDTMRSVNEYHQRYLDSPDRQGAPQRPELTRAISSSTLFVESEFLGADMGKEKFQYCAAFVDMLRGRYRRALENATHAWEGFRDRLGPRHFETLRSARLRVGLLALVGNMDDAEQESNKLLPILGQELGPKHPFYLETGLTLVYIFRIQRRLVEAVETAGPLLKTAGAALPQHHPLVLRLTTELAHCHRSAGDYETAKSILLSKVAEHSHRGTGDVGLDTLHMLRLETELSHTNCLIGELEEAERCVMAVLRKIRIMSGRSKKSPAIPPTDRAGGTEEADETLLEECLTTLGTENWVHPTMLYALRVAATVKSQFEDANSDLIQRVLDSVWQWQARGDVLGAEHPASLMTRFDYAVVLRDFREDEKAISVFRQVFAARRKVLGELHPDTQTARRELIATRCSTGLCTDIDVEDAIPTTVNDSRDDRDSETGLEVTIEKWDLVELRSRDIFHIHQERLGLYHPETIRSLMWIFTVQLQLGKVGCAAETYRILAKRFNSARIVRERLLGSLQNQERIARYYLDLSHDAEGIKILRDMIEFFSGKNVDNLSPMLQDLKSRVEHLVSKHQALGDAGGDGGSNMGGGVAVMEPSPAGNTEPEDSGREETGNHPSTAAMVFPRLQFLKPDT